MRIVLTAVNAKYIHSNLAVYSLKASAGRYEPHVELAEYTINHRIDEIFADLYQKRPELLLFSCYIWNRREIVEVAGHLRKVLPNLIIWAGGPEVSAEPERFLREHPQFDGVMVGEGERTFFRLLSYYIEGNGEIGQIPGIAWRPHARRQAFSGGMGCAADVSLTGASACLRCDEGLACLGFERQQMEVAAGNGLCGGEAACPASGIRNQEEAEDVIRRTTPAEPLPTLDALPFVYGDLSRFENRILYYESSRGCPFSCSYCLSSLDRRVRYRSLALVKKELLYFLEKRVKQVKFIDRTFNCSRSRTAELWRFLGEHDNGVTNFHFEISADLLNEEELEVLSTLRPGLVQLEIGVQTVNPDTLAAIHRTAPFEKIAANVKRISAAHNVHQHLDLIAGLPYEDLESFRNSFDAVYRLRPQELQLGFLKVLEGSELHRRAEEYGILYRSTPPYEVLATRWLRCEELLFLKEVEEMLEVYYNSMQFRNTIRAAEHLFDRPFSLYAALAAHYRREGLNGRAWSRAQRLEILREFLRARLRSLGKTDGEQGEAYFDELLLLDLYLRENARSRPEWAADLTPWKDAVHRCLRAEEERQGVRKTLRTVHVERFTHLSAPEMAYGADVEILPGKGAVWLLFEYEKRDPLTFDASVRRVFPASENA